MSTIHEKFIVDKKGKPRQVVLDIDDYMKILAIMEELESIRAYDKAKASGSALIPFEKAVREIEKKHK